MGQVHQIHHLERKIIAGKKGKGLINTAQKYTVITARNRPAGAKSPTNC